MCDIIQMVQGFEQFQEQEVEKMGYDYSLLEGKIVEVFGTRGEFAKAMEFSERTLSLKMNGKVPWKQPEITKACKLLGILDKKINLYFFTMKVQNV